MSKRLQRRDEILRSRFAKEIERKRKAREEREAMQTIVVEATYTAADIVASGTTYNPTIYTPSQFYRLIEHGKTCGKATHITWGGVPLTCLS